MNSNDELKVHFDSWVCEAFDFDKGDDAGMQMLIQGLCNVHVERPMLLKFTEAEPFQNMNGKNVRTMHLDTEIGPIRLIMMGKNVVLAPFEITDISTKESRSKYLDLAYVNCPMDFDFQMEHLTHFEVAVIAGTNMIRELALPRPKSFQPRYTHPSMGLDEPEGFSFLFRLEDKSHYFLTFSEKGVVLSLPDTPCKAINEKTISEVHKDRDNFWKRNPRPQYS